MSDVIRELRDLLDDEDTTTPPWDPGFGHSIVGTANRTLAFAAVNALPGLLDEIERLRGEIGHHATRIEQQRSRLAELEQIVANHAEHYRKPILRSAEAARNHIVAWQEQFFRANAAEREVERLRVVKEAAAAMRQPICSCSRWDIADGPPPPGWTKRVCSTCVEFDALRAALADLGETT